VGHGFDGVHDQDRCWAAKGGSQEQGAGQHGREAGETVQWVRMPEVLLVTCNSSLRCIADMRHAMA